MIKYSFLVAVYNVEEYLIECVESLLSIDGFKEDCEIILVDDGSTDNSATICDEYDKRYSQIRVIHQENRGLLQARRTAVEHSRGEYLIFIDSDDYVDTTLLFDIEKYLDSYSPDFLMYGYKKINGSFISYVRLTDKEYVILSQEDITELFVTSEDYNGIACKVVKADLLKNHLDEIYSCSLNIGEDKLQTAYIIKYSNIAVLVGCCPYYYRVRSDSIVHKKTIADLFDVINMYQIVRSVILDIGRINVHVKKKEEYLISKYDVVALDGTMDHIYKYNTRKDLSIQEKKEGLMSLLSTNKSFFNLEVIIAYNIHKYNYVRYRLLISERIDALLFVDRFISMIKMKDR